MNKLQILLLISLVIFVLPLVSAAQPLSDGDKAAIVKLYDNVSKGLETKDSALFLSSFAENIVQIGTDTTIIRGKDHLEQSLKWMENPDIPKAKRDYVIQDIYGHGDVAYMWETTKASINFGKRTFNNVSTSVKIARKQSNGNWLFVVDMYNLENISSTTEDDINMLGYELIDKKEYDKAARIFELNVEFYPESFNVYDSLGEAYFYLGKDDLAIKNYQKSLELDPSNKNAETMIQKIKEKEK